MKQKLFVTLHLLLITTSGYGVFGWFKKESAAKEQASANTPTAEDLLTDIRTNIQKLRISVANALEKNSLNKSDVEATIKSLDANAKILPPILSSIDAATRNNLLEQAQTITLAYQALQEEAAVLDSWVQGYDAYEKDLQDNFKKLPNDALARPDLKKLYTELGIAPADIAKQTFNSVRAQYQKLFDTLKAKAGASFDILYFRPYLRVLDYIFRTAYSKAQYDAYLAGKATYDKKAAALKPYAATIHTLFNQDLSRLKSLYANVNCITSKAADVSDCLL